MGNAHLRPAVDSDDRFLFELYASTRQAELACMPWSPDQKNAFLRMQFEAQTRHYRSYYPQATHSVVITDDACAGRLYVDRQDSQVLIVDLTLLPQFHRQGIGRALVAELQREAASSRKALTGHVEKHNPAAVFWRNMGFTLTEQDELYFRMSWEGTASDVSI